VMDASLAEPDVRATVTRAFAAWTDPIARIAQGEGLSPARARQFAMTTVAAIEGGLLLARASESLDPLRDVEASLLLLAEALRG
jgi:transcriptional regulator LmrA/YxaF-like protein